MRGAISRIGQMRDPGDPNDPRRKLGARPLRPGDPRITNPPSIEQMLREGKDEAFIRDPAVAKGFLTKRGDPTRGTAEAPASRIDDLRGVSGRGPTLQERAEGRARANLTREDLALLAQEEPEILKEYLRGMAQERDVLPERKKDVQIGDIDDDFRKGSYIPRVGTPEPAAFGSVPVPFRDERGQIIEKNVYPSELAETRDAPGDLKDSTFAPDRTQELTLGALIGEAQQGRKTPVMGREALETAYRNKDFVHSPDRSRVGFLKKGDERIPIYRVAGRNDIFRVGVPTARDYDAARRDIGDPRIAESNALTSQIVGKYRGKKGDPTRGTAGAPASRIKPEMVQAMEIGAVPFLNRDDVYSKIGGLRRNVEKKSGTSFNELLGELQAGAFMDSPSVGSIYRDEAATQGQILQLRQQGYNNLADRLEAGLSQQQRSRTGREVDLFSEEPADPRFQEEYVVEREMTNQDITGQSTGDVENLGYSVISPQGSFRDADAVAESGPVRVVQPSKMSVAPNFSAAEAEKVRQQYRNPELTSFLRATSQPEIDIQSDPIQREYDRRLALLRPQLAETAAVEQQSSNRPQISSINATNNSMANAPAPQLDVESQEQVLERKRQNVLAGLMARITGRS